MGCCHSSGTTVSCCVWEREKESGGSPATQMQTHPFTPACHHEAVVQRRGNYPFQNIHLWRVFYLLNLWQSQLCLCLQILKQNSTQFSREKAMWTLSEYFWHIWSFGRSTQGYSHCQMPSCGLVFLESTNQKDRSFWYTFISQQGASRAERRPLSDKNTKIYKHVVLSHKVKDLKVIWSYCGIGRGGVREPENVSQSETQLKCWVYCLLHRNHLLCTAEHNNRDRRCVEGQTTANCSSL